MTALRGGFSFRAHVFRISPCSSLKETASASPNH